MGVDTTKFGEGQDRRNWCWFKDLASYIYGETINEALVGIYASSTSARSRFCNPSETSGLLILRFNTQSAFASTPTTSERVNIRDHAIN